MRFPDDFAGAFVEANQTRAVGAADGEKDVIAFDDATAVIAAAAGRAFIGFAAEERNAEVFFEADAPKRFAVGNIQATKLAFAGLDVEPVAIENRSTAGTGTPFVLEHVGVSDLPQFFAGRGVDKMGDFFAVLCVQKGELAGGHDGRGETPANLFTPKNSRSARNGWRTLFLRGGMAGAIRPTPLGPVAGDRLDAEKC